MGASAKLLCVLLVTISILVKYHRSQWELKKSIPSLKKWTMLKKICKWFYLIQILKWLHHWKAHIILQKWRFSGSSWTLLFLNATWSPSKLRSTLLWKTIMFRTQAFLVGVLNFHHSKNYGDNHFWQHH